jgi:hypothetical protein
MRIVRSVAGGGITTPVVNGGLLRGGSTFPVLGADVALGLGVSFGSNEVPSLVDLGAPQGPETPPDNLNQEVKYWRLKLIFGFTTGN